MVKNYKYSDLSIVSAKLPQNTHLWTETSAGVLYLVDSTDNTKLYKSTDKGDNWTQVDCDPDDIYGGANDKERPKKIARSWYDRVNDYIYFVDCNYDRTTSYVWYIDLSDDSIVEVDSAPDNIYDVFIIGTKVFMVYFSSSFEILTQTIRPTGDNSIDWEEPVFPGTAHWDRINDAVNSPTNGGDVTVGTNGSFPGDYPSDYYDMDTIDLGGYASGIVTQLKVYINAKTDGGTVLLGLFGNQAGTTNEKSAQFTSTSYSYRSGT